MNLYVAQLLAPSLRTLWSSLGGDAQSGATLICPALIVWARSEEDAIRAFWGELAHSSDPELNAEAIRRAFPAPGDVVVTPLEDPGVPMIVHAPRYPISAACLGDFAVRDVYEPGPHGFADPFAPCQQSTSDPVIATDSVTGERLSNTGDQPAGH